MRGVNRWSDVEGAVVPLASELGGVWPATPESFVDFMDEGGPWDCRNGIDRARVCFATDWQATDALWADRNERPEAVATAKRRRNEVIEAAMEYPGYKLADILEHTLGLAGDGLELGELKGDPGPQTIRWPSGIPKVNDACGGFYGVSTILGGTGVGKSIVAVASAVEAACAGIRVVYFNAEIPRKPFMARVGRRVNGSQDRMDRVLDNFTHYIAGPGLTLEQMQLAALEVIKPHDARLLIVVDSINTVAEFLEGPGYFEALRQLGFWGMESRKQSEGRIGWLFVSERNQRGDVKGSKLAYLSDLILSVEAGQAPDYVKLIVTKGREGGGGDLGSFLREWKTGEFLGENELQTPTPNPQDRMDAEGEPVW